MRKLIKQWSSLVAGVALAAIVAGPAMAAEKADLYPLTTCPISGKELTADAVVKEYDGREVRFCCGGCPGKFEEDQAASLAKLDEAIISDQDADYPLTVCVNSGEALGDSPQSFVLGNRLIKTCCPSCKATLEKDEAAALEKHAGMVADAIGEDYPSDKCAVSGEPLGSMGEPVNVMVGNSLVKLCCAGCNKAVVKDPAKYVAAVWSGEAKSSEETSDEGKGKKKD